MVSYSWKVNSYFRHNISFHVMIPASLLISWNVFSLERPSPCFILPHTFLKFYENPLKDRAEVPCHRLTVLGDFLLVKNRCL